MSAICEKCGREIDGKSPICMYCGAAVTDSCLTEETKERLQNEAAKEPEKSIGTNMKAIGAFLVILGILADVISMFMITTSDIGAFSAVTITGTIMFLIGIALISNS